MVNLMSYKYPSLFGKKDIVILWHVLLVWDIHVLCCQADKDTSPLKRQKDDGAPIQPSCDRDI
jgi:hypothetical protein